jgi:hypothetical protein
MSPRRRFVATGFGVSFRHRPQRPTRRIFIHFSNSARRNAALIEHQHIFWNFSRTNGVCNRPEPA